MSVFSPVIEYLFWYLANIRIKNCQLAQP